MLIGLKFALFVVSSFLWWGWDKVTWKILAFQKMQNFVGTLNRVFTVFSKETIKQIPFTKKNDIFSKMQWCILLQVYMCTCIHVRERECERA